MKTILFAAGVMLAACGGASAQTASATTVAACGTQTYPTGYAYPLSQTTTGNLCDSGGGGGGGGSTTLVPSATGGLSPFTNDVTNTAQAVSAAAAGLYAYAIFNPNAAVCFLQFYNATAGSVTVGTTVPTWSVGIPALGGANLAFAIPISFGTALSVAATTTAAGGTACTSPMRTNIGFK